MKVEEFYKELFQEIKSTQASEENGGIQEQIFTQLAIDLLADAGETENARICFDRKEDKLGRTMHKLNGYALSENYETLDLFVTVFKGVEEPFTLTKQEAESSINQVERFFRNAVYKDYIKELEESSEVFDLAHTLAEVKEVRDFLSRVNIFVLSNGVFKSDLNANKTISGYSVYTRIIDIEYLFNLSDQTHVPIEINFEKYGGILPCLESPSENDDYESYLALIPGATLANIYEEYGSRLLEQNVRSFLQFTGKINKGIRKTIKEEPHMFLAFNNGIAATADELSLVDIQGGGKAIIWAKDFQIVNGGQTTASVYHTWKKDKAEIDKIFVQTKITVIKKREDFNEIVNRIAEYANTQNKVSTSDLSSNKPFHVELEKISRSLWAQPVEGSNIQTHWFYERARGQYKNARLKEGFKLSRRTAFDQKNPRGQIITKELLAKYVNTYQEIWNGKRLAIGPHIVVRGNQKNYVQFLNYTMPDKPDNVFYEDAVAKAIMFKNAEKLYGVSPNAIGDMRYITVPYSLSLLNLKTDYKIDLYKIWKNQVLSEKMKSVLYNLMKSVETFIKKNAPGNLYGEWAKKEECWNSIKEHDFGIDFNELKSEFINPATAKRKSLTEDEVNLKIINQEIELIKSISSDIWDVIERWGAKTGQLSKYLQDIALNISVSIRNNRPINDALRIKGISIIEIIIHEAPEILENDIPSNPIKSVESQKQILKFDVQLITKMAEWDSRVKVLSPNQRSYISDFAFGFKKINSFHEKNLMIYYEKLKASGFKM